MTKHRFARSIPAVSRQTRRKVVPPEDSIIRGDFGDYLRGLGYAPYTIEHYQYRLLRVARWLCAHGRYPRMRCLTRSEVPRLLTRFIPGGRPQTLICYRKPLFHWLRFSGHYTLPATQARWQPLLEDYLQFIRIHRGVTAATTIQRARVYTSAFLRALFGRGKADWTRIRPPDIWRFAHQYSRGVKPATVRDRLGQIRRFLRFLQMRGACSPQLVVAFPKVALYASGTRPEILSEHQQHALLACFRRTQPEGKRDYAMTVCMLHLGLRAGEVIRLRLQDIDWQNRRLSVPPTKTGRGRQLPIPEQVLAALRDYVRNGRPDGGAFDQIFLRHPRRKGHPLSQSALKLMVMRAYRRCGFPRSWVGTHRLRHTFASRLHQRGADLKPIADLLGHRWLDSTNFYTQIAPQALQALAQPWPRL